MARVPLARVAAAALLTAATAAPLPGFRPPAVPLFVQSPEISLWSRGDNLNDVDVSHWTGASVDMFAAVRVDGAPYLLLGNPSPAWHAGGLQTATQLAPAAVWATQTKAAFTAGAVSLNLTFTTPLLTENWDLLSRPASYVTMDVASADGAEHAVELYFDVRGWRGWRGWVVGGRGREKKRRGEGERGRRG